MCEKHVFSCLGSDQRQRNKPSLPTALLAVFSAMNGNAVSFSVFLSHTADPIPSFRFLLFDLKKKAFVCIPILQNPTECI